MTADELAQELGISAKTLRAWLRRTGARTEAEHGRRWVLDQEQIEAARAQFERRASGERALATKGRSRTASDEWYVIDLCDEILPERARRQHCFPWLLGDPGKDGTRRPLPVDAYYEGQGIVVEYRERQHAQATPFFDRRQTFSRMGRGRPAPAL